MWWGVRVGCWVGDLEGAHIYRRRGGICELDRRICSAWPWRWLWLVVCERREEGP